MEQFTKDELFVIMVGLRTRARILEEKLQTLDYSKMPKSSKKGDEDYVKELRDVADKAERMYLKLES